MNKPLNPITRLNPADSFQPLIKQLYNRKGCNRNYRLILTVIPGYRLNRLPLILVHNLDLSPDDHVHHRVLQFERQMPCL